MDVMMVDRSAWDQSFVDSDFAPSTSAILPSSGVVDDRLSASGLLRCQQTAAWVAAAAGNDAAAAQQQRQANKIASASSTFYQNGHMVSVDSRRQISNLQRSCSPIEPVAPSRSSAVAVSDVRQSSPVSATAASKALLDNWHAASESSSSSSSSSSELGRLSASISGTTAAPVQFDFQLVQALSAAGDVAAVCPLKQSSSSAHLLDVDQTSTTTAVCRSSSSPNCFDDVCRLPSPSSLTGSPNTVRRPTCGDGAPVRAASATNDVVAEADTSTIAPSYSVVASFLPSWDMERLDLVYRRLAACGFYVGRMSVDEAARRLARWPVGSFLLRDSSDRRYMFSVSVQTCRGTTSVRMAYRSGLFRLDCHPDQEHLMPTFDCALRLLRHYVGLCRRAAASANSGGTSGSSASPPPPPPSAVSGSTAPGGHGYVLLETTGRRDTPVLLRTPYRERTPTLAHLCRLTVNRSVAGNGTLATTPGVAPSAAVDRLQLLPSLKNYLKDYPYDI